MSTSSSPTRTNQNDWNVSILLICGGDYLTSLKGAPNIIARALECEKEVHGFPLTNNAPLGTACASAHTLLPELETARSLVYLLMDETDAPAPALLEQYEKLSELVRRCKICLEREVFLRIPPEVLLEIFKFAYGSTAALHQDLQTLTIRSVCRRWSDIALDASFLWTFILVSWNPRVGERRLIDLFLERSKKAPIRVHIINSLAPMPEDWSFTQSVAPWLQQSGLASRIESLSVGFLQTIKDPLAVYLLKHSMVSLKNFDVAAWTNGIQDAFLSKSSQYSCTSLVMPITMDIEAVPSFATTIRNLRVQLQCAFAMSLFTCLGAAKVLEVLHIFDSGCWISGTSIQLPLTGLPSLLKLNIVVHSRTLPLDLYLGAISAPRVEQLTLRSLAARITDPWLKCRTSSWKFLEAHANSLISVSTKNLPIHRDFTANPVFRRTSIRLRLQAAPWGPPLPRFESLEGAEPPLQENEEFLLREVMRRQKQDVRMEGRDLLYTRD